MVEVYKKSYVYHEADVEMTGMMLYCFGLSWRMRSDGFSSVVIYLLLVCGSCLEAIKEPLEKKYCVELGVCLVGTRKVTDFAVITCSDGVVCVCECVCVCRHGKLWSRKLSQKQFWVLCNVFIMSVEPVDRFFVVSVICGPQVRWGRMKVKFRNCRGASKEFTLNIRVDAVMKFTGVWVEIKIGSVCLFLDSREGTGKVWGTRDAPNPTRTEDAAVNGQQHFHLETTRPYDMTHITNHVGQYQVEKKKNTCEKGSFVNIWLSEYQIILTRSLHYRQVSLIFRFSPKCVVITHLPHFKQPDRSASHLLVFTVHDLYFKLVLHCTKSLLLRSKAWVCVLLVTTHKIHVARQ